MMGNSRSFIIASFLVLTIFVVFQLELLSSTNSTPEQTLKVTPPEKINYKSDSNKRNIAQAEEIKFNSPRGTQKIRMTPAHSERPRPSELKEIDIPEIRESWKLWFTKKVVLPRESSEESQFLKVGNFTIQDSTKSNLNLNNFSSQEPWVVFNERLNTVGILTGTISFQLNDIHQWKLLEEELNLKLIHSFSDIGLYLVTSQMSRFDLLSMFEILKSKPQVQKVEIEIVSRSYVQ
jgi:hypothetical protein